MKPTISILLAALWLPAGSAVAQAAPAKPRVATARATRPKKTLVAPVAASAPLGALFNAYWEDRARLFPFNATAQGVNRYNDQLPNDQTRTFRQQQQQFYQQ